MINDLKANQSFINDNTATTVSFDLNTKKTITGQAANTPLAISYDAANNNYIVSTGSFSGTFGPANRQPDRFSGEAQYRTISGTTSTYLTLATTPYTRSTSNKYVGLGYLQQNVITGSQQDTKFSTFTYGFASSPSAVPRSGTATFAIDVFGLESLSGIEPHIFQGLGRFDVDFAAGQFSTTTNLTDTGFITGQAVVGGGIELTGGGYLASGDGSFTGGIVFGSSNQRLGGTIVGRFYGPAADELGATFAASAANGSAVNGAFTGWRDTTTFTPVNISFARLATPQLFFGDATSLTVRTPKPGSSTSLSISDYPGSLGSDVSRAQIELKTGGIVSFGTPTSNMPSGTYTPSMIVAGDPNFVTYQQDIVGQPTKLDLYKTGSANSELALTYASFGRYATSGTSDPFQTEVDRVFFAYGFKTPNDLLGSRTGTATYTGVAYGAAANPAGTISDVAGTEQLTVDFSAQKLGGTLALHATSGLLDYGTFNFNGRLFSAGSDGTADISRGTGSPIGIMLINFYGPAGEEAAGPFRLVVPDGAGSGTLITGVTAAKRP